MALKGLLEDAGLRVRAAGGGRGAAEPRRAPAGASDGPAARLLGHVDTVLADPGEWSVDPWSGELRDGCVWGRGALDMKSQVAAEAAAGARARRGGLAARVGRAAAVFTADEEAGAQAGARGSASEHPDKVRAATSSSTRAPAS